MSILVKAILSALIIVTVSELAKRVSWFAAIIASLPLTSILALCWLYYDTKDMAKVISLSNHILLALLPSLVFFVALPIFLKANFRFSIAMTASCVTMSLAYFVYMITLKYMGVKL